MLYYSIIFIESMLCIVCILYSLIAYVQCIALLIHIRALSMRGLTFTSTNLYMPYCSLLSAIYSFYCYIYV